MHAHRLTKSEGSSSCGTRVLSLCFLPAKVYLGNDACSLPIAYSCVQYNPESHGRNASIPASASHKFHRKTTFLRLQRRLSTVVFPIQSSLTLQSLLAVLPSRSFSARVTQVVLPASLTHRGSGCPKTAKTSKVSISTRLQRPPCGVYPCGLVRY